MGRPSGGYFTKDGTRVPSVTTVLGKFKDPGGLMYWAWKEGKEGRDFRQTSGTAASIGTLAHSAIEAHYLKQKFDWKADHGLDSDGITRAKRAFTNAKAWGKSSKYTVTHTEMSLLSEEHGFGGTLDGALTLGFRSLADWKTSNAVYPDMLAQLGAYGILWDEAFPDDPITGGFDLLRFSKDFGDFTHHHFDELDAGKRYFLNLLAAYYDSKELIARCK